MRRLAREFAGLFYIRSATNFRTQTPAGLNPSPAGESEKALGATAAPANPGRAPAGLPKPKKPIAPFSPPYLRDIVPF